MKSFSTTILFLLSGFLSQAQIINIPDANFKAKLLEASPSNTIARNTQNQYFKIDSNNDGEIQLSEALEVYGLNLNNANIESLEG
ncbi:MAG: T9SS C-terminal target domain-containing protein, partial [Flavobacterium sp.]